MRCASWRRALGAGTMLLALLPAACARIPVETEHPAGATASAAEPSAAPNEVIIDNFTFRPVKLSVPVGTKVTWINRDDVPHTATSAVKPRAFDSGTLGPGRRRAQAVVLIFPHPRRRTARTQVGRLEPDRPL